MDNRFGLFLAFQALPLVFLLFAVGGLTISVAYEYKFYGHEELPAMTDWERNPIIIKNQFLNSVGIAIFFFLIGLPFELILFYFDKQDQIKNQKVKREKLRYT